MTNISEITALIMALRAEQETDAISPESLGSLLQRILNLIADNVTDEQLAELQTQVNTIRNTVSDMVVSGVTLTFISFFINGDVTEGVLWYMAQALTFAGAIFGVSIYFKTKLGESEQRLRQFLNDKLKNKENEAENNS